jgi:ribonuclease HepT-like protein
MSPAEVASAVRLRLASDIETELASQTRVAERIAALRSRLAAEPGDWVVAAAMAFEIERWYTAVESLLVRILRTLEGDVPAGPARHRELLRAASLAVEPLRPALVSPAAEGDLRELLGFRHFARHAYDVEPEPARMLEHGDRVARLQVALGASMVELVLRLRSAS